MSINDYNLEKLIGAGTFGEIYRGTEKCSGMPVAIKRLKKRLLYENGEFLLKSYRKEIEIMRLCECDNSIKFFKEFESEDHFNIIMELCDKDLLVYLYERKTQFTIDEVRETFLQLNNAFKRMRANNILHRDLKLGNVLIKFTDESKTKFIPKLADYGFSKELNIYNTRTTHLGTPATMAPEIMMNMEYDDKSDLWSVAVMMYQLYYKEIPYDGMTEQEIFNKIKSGAKYKQPEDPDFRDLINRILVMDPKKRMTWDDYFNHPFFTRGQLSKKVSVEIEGKNMFNSYCKMDDFFELKSQSSNLNPKGDGFQVQCDIYGKSKSEELIKNNKYKLEILSKGEKITKEECDFITNIGINSVKRELVPMSSFCMNEIKNKLKGEWFIFVVDDMEINYDFYLSFINDGRFIVFNVGEFQFQVAQIN